MSERGSGRERLLVIGNWKMHLTPEEGRALAAAVAGQLADENGPEVVVAPAFPALWPVAEALAGSRVGLAAQDVFHEREGAFTGAVSAPMLAAVGCRRVLVGHSERRHVFGDSDDDVLRKARAVLEAGMEPVLCVGETADEHDEGRKWEVVERQLGSVLGRLHETGAGRVTLAYEPVWAIGTGHAAIPEMVQAMHGHIREIATGLLGAEAADRARILYGGSVTSDNAGDFIAGADVDGLLVGGASLKADSFLGVCRATPA